MKRGARRHVEKYLRSVGWRDVDDVLTAPSGGVWLLASHFTIWEPREMLATFRNRARRIREQHHEGCEEAARENDPICAALTHALTTADNMTEDAVLQPVKGEH